LKELSYSDEVQGERVYMYNDDGMPTRTTAHMNSYLKKLAILAKLRLEREY